MKYYLFRNITDENLNCNFTYTISNSRLRCLFNFNGYSQRQNNCVHDLLYRYILQHHLQLNPVKTPLGEIIDSSSEEWRAWCEAIHVLKLTKLNDRQLYIESVTKVRGQKAAQTLQDNIRVIWNLSKP